MRWDADKRTVAEDGRAEWLAEGVGLQLLPETPHTRFPVQVRLDGDASRVLTVGSGEERGEAFHQVEVVNGRPGDVWRLVVAPTAGAGARQHGRRDADGRAVVRVGGGTLVAHVDFAADDSLPVDGGVGETRLYLCPGDKGFKVVPVPLADLGSGTGEADPRVWDVRDLARLRFTYQAEGPADGYGGMSFGLVIEGLARDDWRARPVFEAKLGTVDDFTTTGGFPGAGGTASLELGAYVASSSAWRVVSTERANFLRVCLVKSAGLPLSPGFGGPPPGAGAVPLPCAATFTVEGL